MPKATSLGLYAFKDCKKLESVECPKVTKFTKEDFRNCSSLVSITWSDNLTYVDHGTFNGCSKLTTIGSLAKCTYLNEYAFYGCSSLTSVGDTPLVTRVCYYAFNGCTSLTELSLPACTQVDGGAFYNCQSLTTISLPACSTHGGGSGASGTFNKCYALTTLELPKITSMPSRYTGGNVGQGNISLCKSLTELALPACVTYAAKGGVRDNVALESFTISESVKSLNGDDLNGCTALKYIYSAGTNGYGYSSDLASTLSLADSSVIDHDTLVAFFNGAFDRATAEYENVATIKLSSTTYATLSDEELAVMTTKGFTITSA